MTSRTYPTIFLDQCCLKASIFKFWFCIRPMENGWSTL